MVLKKDRFVVEYRCSSLAVVSRVVVARLLHLFEGVVHCVHVLF